MERLLCIKIASRGDLLLAAPAFRRLRRRRPNASITLLTGASCADVAHHLPYFDEIQTLDDHALMGAGPAARIGAAWNLWRRLRSRKSVYTECFIFHRDWRYGFLAWLAQIPCRRGFHAGFGHVFLTHAYVPGEKEHHIHQYLGMAFLSVECGARSAEFIQETMRGVWQFAKGERREALAMAAVHGFDPETQKSWVGLGFGGGRNVKTRTELKTWPLGHYRQLAQRLVERGYRVAWVGDREDAAALGHPEVGVNLAGKLSVPQTAAVLSACERVVSNDTLTLHLAEALGISALGIFGPTDPSHYRPLGERSSLVWMGDRLECSPCHRDGYFPPCRFQHRCMREISVEQVLSQFKECP